MVVKLNKINIAIILSDYYKEISEGLLSGAVEYCEKYNLGHKVFKVPGALEIGSAIKIISEVDSNEPFNGFIALGCVIRGETSHFEIVINESARALTNLSINNSLIIGNGILTVENNDQAINRSSDDSENKGYHAAYACHSLIELKDGV